MARPLSGFFLKKKPHCKLFASARNSGSALNPRLIGSFLNLICERWNLLRESSLRSLAPHLPPAPMGDLLPSAKCFTCRVLRILPDFLWNCKGKRIDRGFLPFLKLL